MLSHFRNRFSKVIVVGILILHVNSVSGETNPSETDMVLAATGVGLAIGIELFAKDHLLPDQPRFTTPNAMDARIREYLYWGEQRQELAADWSDRLVYGVSLSSLAWGPALANNHELSALINMEVFALNSMLTNMVKVLAGRERPYHYYGTRSAQGQVDYASFISGHSSVAFSQAVSNAIVLSQNYPHQSGLIWSSLLGMASGTAYLRVAGDMHYFSDILVGAGMGTLIAWVITEYELDHHEDVGDSDTNFMLTFKIPLG